MPAVMIRTVRILDIKCYGDDDERRGTTVRLLVETLKRSPGGRRMADALPSESQEDRSQNSMIRNHHGSGSINLVSYETPTLRERALGCCDHKL
jgi:hypothetical protein